MMNETVTLRPLCVGDATEMAVVLSHPDLYRYTGGEPPSEADLERLYGIQTRGGPADRSEVWLNDIIVVGDNRRAVGFVQVTLPVDQRSAEISWVVGRPWQGSDTQLGPRSFSPTTFAPAESNRSSLTSIQITRHLRGSPSGSA